MPERAKFVRPLDVPNPGCREGFDPKSGAAQCAGQGSDAIAVSGCVRTFKERSAQVSLMTCNDEHRCGDGLMGRPALEAPKHVLWFSPGVGIGKGGFGHPCRPRIVAPGSLDRRREDGRRRPAPQPMGDSDGHGGAGRECDGSP